MSVIKMENEQVETMMGPKDLGPLWGPKAPQPSTAGWGLRTSRPQERTAE